MSSDSLRSNASCVIHPGALVSVCLEDSWGLARARQREGGLGLAESGSAGSYHLARNATREAAGGAEW